MKIKRNSEKNLLFIDCSPILISVAYRLDKVFFSPHVIKPTVHILTKQSMHHDDISNEHSVNSLNTIMITVYTVKPGLIQYHNKS